MQYTFPTLKNARNVNSKFIVQVHTSSNVAFVNKEKLRNKAELSCALLCVSKFCENKVDKICGGFNFCFTVINSRTNPVYFDSR